MYDIEKLIAAAKAHGENSHGENPHPEHEVGDLQDLLRLCWERIPGGIQDELCRTAWVQDLLHELN